MIFGVLSIKNFNSIVNRGKVFLIRRSGDAAKRHLSNKLPTLRNFESMMKFIINQRINHDQSICTLCFLGLKIWLNGLK